MLCTNHNGFKQVIKQYIDFIHNITEIFLSVIVFISCGIAWWYLHTTIKHSKLLTTGMLQDRGDLFCVFNCIAIVKALQRINIFTLIFLLLSWSKILQHMAGALL